MKRLAIRNVKRSLEKCIDLEWLVNYINNNLLIENETKITIDTIVMFVVSTLTNNDFININQRMVLCSLDIFDINVEPGYNFGHLLIRKTRSYRVRLSPRFKYYKEYIDHLHIVIENLKLELFKEG